MEAERIGRNVKKLRLKKGLSQEALAEKAGISLRTLQRIEKGETTPRGDTLQRLAMALETSPDELIDWQEQEDKTMLLILNFSMLCFLIFSLLGVIVSLVVWISQKDKVRGVKSLGQKILNFQITLSLIILGVYIMGMMSVFFRVFHHSIYSQAWGLFSLVIVSFVIKFYCLVIALVNAYLISMDKKVWYKPAIPFLR